MASGGQLLFRGFAVAAGEFRLIFEPVKHLTPETGGQDARATIFAL